MNLLRYLWAGPNTLLALPLAAMALLTGGAVRRTGGLLEIHGRPIAWLLRRLVPLPGGASAMTIGHVVIGRDDETLRRCRAHERVHVRQYERWGPLFIPAYLLASLLAYSRGGDLYRDNAFEREARRQSRPSSTG